MPKQQNGDDIQEVEVNEVAQTAVVLSSVEKDAIDIQVATAKQYPRSIQKSMDMAVQLATYDEEVAGSCFYSLPRAGKKIEGPSARLAEIMMHSWGNLRADCDVVGDDETHVTAVSTCFDLERNVAVRVRVRRRITYKDGRRFDSDMIGVTGNAALSIALRNSVFKVIPKPFTDRVYKAAREAYAGKGGTFAQKRQNALEWFAKVGLYEPKLFELLQINGPEEIGTDELITLRGLMTAIKDGDVSVESIIDQGIEETLAAQTARRLEEKKAEMEKKDEEKAKEEEKKEPPKKSQKKAGKAAKAEEKPAESEEQPPLSEDEKPPWN